MKNDRHEIECDISYQIVDVHSLIDDVLSPKIGVKPNIFISSSAIDKQWLQRLQTHLNPLILNQMIEIWDNTQISPGQQWGQEITAALDNATIAILLVSPNFFASKFIADYELPLILKAAEVNKLTIIWIPISASLITKKLNNYQAAHNPSEPLDSLPISDQNRILIKVCQEIKRIVTGENRE